VKKPLPGEEALEGQRERNARRELRFEERRKNLRERSLISRKKKDPVWTTVDSRVTAQK